MTTRNRRRGSGAEPERRGLSTAQQIAAIAGAVTAVVGAVAAVIALVDGDGGSGTPPPKPVADQRVVRFEPNVTREQFARRFPDLVPGDLSITEGNRRGGVWHLEFEFSNFGKQQCTLRWTMIDDANDSPVPGGEFVDQPAGDFMLDGPHEQFKRSVWVPAPEAAGKVFFVFAMTNEKGRPCGHDLQTDPVGTGRD